MRVVCVLFSLMTIAAPLCDQSLYLNAAERAIEAGAAWWVGSSSNGAEFLFSASPASRVDVDLMMTLAEQSFRRETYRGARISFVRRM